MATAHALETPAAPPVLVEAAPPERSFEDLAADAREVQARLARLQRGRSRRSIAIPVQAMSMVEDLGTYGD